MEASPWATALRTHACGELRAEHAGREVRLCGWIANRRDHGGIFFLDLRDRFGLVQVTVDPECKEADEAMLALAASLRAEDVVCCRGRVCLRPESQVNPDRETGEIEVVATDLEVLTRAETPPIDLFDDAETGTELRLKYRYLDLRRRPMLRALEARAAFVTALRRSLEGLEFLEVETPILTKTTPEGARDYLVPSRIHKGSVYALPQSPQIFKQILMLSGVDRYYQIARCFRDEDLRADRQPEFTQCDLEMSFVEEEDVMRAVETAVAAAFEEAFGVEVELPMPRISYGEAMRRFGSDKPDLRFGLELVEASDFAAGTGFRVFDGAVEDGGAIVGLRVPGGASLSRKEIQALEECAREHGAKGLAWCKVGGGELTGPLARWFEGGRREVLCEGMKAAEGDLCLFAAGRRSRAQRILGAVRTALGAKLGLADPKVRRFCWVTDFPLFEWSEERERYEFCHHPFTAPKDLEADLAAEPETRLSRAYDLILNGWELGSGSIRIHDPEVQRRVFRFLGMEEEEAQAKFGFLLEAFRYGAPPHGGFAFGIDRIVALGLGLTNLREVIAFPKTTTAACPMTGAPSVVDPAQLEELGWRLDS